MSEHFRPGMNGACKCERRHWTVYVLRGNYSAFNGYKRAWSPYSALRCDLCGHCWRTKAKYVDGVKLAADAR